MKTVDLLRNGMLAAAFSAMLVGSFGCLVDVNEDDNDDFPPAAPRGVTSISGDETVKVVWYANQEHDLAGYEIWRSEQRNSGYRKLTTVSPFATDYDDRDVENGRTYFYGVLAFDDDGNESELSPETVEDTPRPEGRDLTLFDFRFRAERSGLTFADALRGAVDWDRDGDDFLDRDVDIYYGFDGERGTTYIYSDHEDLFMQDLGFHSRMDEVDVAPSEGYTIFSVEALPGHVYAFFTPDGHYAKIRVSRVNPDEITFDWAYQLQRENTDLAPSKRLIPITRGIPANKDR
ncbi:MAG: fibronectin type III domain-containing protein [Candidatus Poribacteria bacterium]|nr:fibronectin type III domain-containing protein [Candidatus Poribacteria bacterium]